MNCECIYYRKNATQEDLLRLAHAMECVSRRFGIDKNPVAISKITKTIWCTEDYDGFGRRKSIPEGSIVLFVDGKLHNMCETYGGGNKKYIALFPVEHEGGFFEDIIDYTDEVFEADCKECKIKCGSGVGVSRCPQ